MPYIWHPYLVYGLLGAAVLAQMGLAWTKGPEKVWIVRRWTLWAVAFLAGIVSDVGLLLGSTALLDPSQAAAASLRSRVSLDAELLLLGWYLVFLTATGGVIRFIVGRLCGNPREAAASPSPPDS